MRCPSFMFVSSPVANSSAGGVSIQMPGFCPWLDFLIPFLFFKEPIDSPQFPSYPFENMPWSKTPVVTHRLAITPVSLLPSVTLECVGFPPCNCRIYPYGPQLYIFRGSVQSLQSCSIQLQTSVSGFACGFH